VNPSHIRDNFYEDFGLQPLPELPSMDWIAAALIANPQIAAAEAELLPSFSLLEKIIIIKNLFPNPILNSHMLIDPPDLLFSLCNTLQEPNEVPMLEFLLAAAPEWSVRRNFVPSTLQAEEQLITMDPHHLPSLRGNLVLTNSNHPIPDHPEISMLPLPLPLPYFLTEPVSSSTLQFLGIPPTPKLMDAKSFLSLIQKDPILVLGGCYSAFNTPAHRRLILCYSEAFQLFIRGFPDFPRDLFHPNIPHHDFQNQPEDSEISTSSESVHWPDSLSEDDIVGLVNLVPHRNRQQ
jgi:hypothetical protein